MDYRALEDLIGILVKKAGYKLGDVTDEEDIEYLLDRKRFVEGEISRLKSSLSENSYIERDDKNKDEEEKAYLEETLKAREEVLSSSSEEEAILIKAEISRLKDLLELVNLKLENKSYYSENKHANDVLEKDILERELDEIKKSLDKKYKSPITLGTNILEAFKNNKSFEEIREDLELLLDLAREEYDKTNAEVTDVNIFELMEEYSNKKEEVNSNLDSSSYDSEKIRQSLFEKEKYHNSRLETFKSTLEGIEKRKEELNTLIDESKKLFDNTHEEIKCKMNKLNKLINVLYNENNLTVDASLYKSTIDQLKSEIVIDKMI